MFHFGPHVHHTTLVATGLLAGAALALTYVRALTHGWAPLRAIPLPAFLNRASHAVRGSDSGAYPPHNRAFEAYKAETIEKMDKEAAEFSAYLAGLKHAADKAAFEAFIAKRKS